MINVSIQTNTILRYAGIGLILLMLGALAYHAYRKAKKAETEREPTLSEALESVTAPDTAISEISETLRKTITAPKKTGASVSSDGLQQNPIPQNILDSINAPQ